MMHNAAKAPTIAPVWWLLPVLLGGRFASVLFPVLVGGTSPDAVEDPELLGATRVVVTLEELERLELDEPIVVVDVDEFVDTPLVVTLK